MYLYRPFEAAFSGVVDNCGHVDSLSIIYFDQIVNNDTQQDIVAVFSIEEAFLLRDKTELPQMRTVTFL